MRQTVQSLFSFFLSLLWAHGFNNSFPHCFWSRSLGTRFPCDSEARSSTSSYFFEEDGGARLLPTFLWPFSPLAGKVQLKQGGQTDLSLCSRGDTGSTHSPLSVPAESSVRLRQEVEGVEHGYCSASPPARSAWGLRPCPRPPQGPQQQGLELRPSSAPSPPCPWLPQACVVSTELNMR